MGRFVKGEIIVTPFPFSDLKSSIKRPALILTTLKGDDVILCQITSKDHLEDPYQILLNKKDFSKGGLKINSFIKPSILFTIRNSIILYSLGKINSSKLKEIEDAVCNIIKN